MERSTPSVDEAHARGRAVAAGAVLVGFHLLTFGLAAGRLWRTTRFAGVIRGYGRFMASYTVNRQGVAQARKLIKARRYVLNSDWGDVQPKAADENAFLKEHSWQEYAGWFLGLTEGPADETKARYAFVYGDLRRLHRSGLIACLYRAAEWRHKEVERAAYRLLQELDAASS
jgi:hypothetical protein